MPTYLHQISEILTEIFVEPNAPAPILIIASHTPTTIFPLQGINQLKLCKGAQKVSDFSLRLYLFSGEQVIVSIGNYDFAWMFRANSSVSSIPI